MGEKKKVLTKRCSKCGEVKAVGQFYENFFECKECNRARKRAYYEKNKTRVKARGKAYREKNKAKINARMKAYREKNGAKISARYKAYYEKNKAKIDAHQRAYREKNKAKIKAYREKNGAKISARYKAYYIISAPKIRAAERVRNSKRDFSVGVSVKTCPVCRKEKPSGDFYVNRRRRDGLSYECKSCRNDYDKGRRFRTSLPGVRAYWSWAIQAQAAWEKERGLKK